MKLFLSVLLLCLASLSVRAVDEEEGKEMLKAMAADCKTKENASDQDLEEMVNKGKPTTPEGKCLNACMFEQFGIIVDNTFSSEGFVEICKLVTENDEQKVATCKEIAEECKSEAGPERCETAAKIISCIEAGAKKRGIDNM